MRVRHYFLVQQLLLLVFVFLLTGCDASKNRHKNNAPLFDNLGKFHHAIHTSSSLAQRYFDQGLILLYSFEYGEAIRSFRAATKTDPHCAMCYWGLALALGSKTDMPLNGHELEDAKKALKAAQHLVNPRNTAEQLYINALVQRYANAEPHKMESGAGLCSSYSLINGQNAAIYVRAMHNLVNAVPNDLDAKTLYAAALFDLIEWNFWTRTGQPQPHTLEIIKLLESIIAADTNHPGANHLYVHILESSPYPERSLSSAERLNKLVPESEHMAHMPCHTYYSVGRYHDATLANENAIELYKKYVNVCNKQGFEAETQYLYYHNLDYLVAASSMEGRKHLALTTAKNLHIEISPLVEKNHFLQKMLTPQILTMARFGEWKRILQVPRPSAQNQYALGIWNYARGLSEIQLNQISVAENHLRKMEEIINKGETEENLGKLGVSQLTIARHILAGLIDYKSGRDNEMVKNFESAVKIQDETDSIDPPPWYFPVRQLLGSALLKIGRPGEAKIVFQQDLLKHPKNGWSLYGLMQSEHALGNEAMMHHAEQQFKEAWKNADIREPVYPL